MKNKDCKDLITALKDNVVVKRQDNFTTRLSSERYTIVFDEMIFEYFPYNNSISWCWSLSPVEDQVEIDNLDYNFTTG